MDRGSYRKAWAAAIKAASKQHPEVAGMVVRNFRSIHKTVLVNAGINPVAVKIIQGHALRVDERYYELDQQVAEEAAIKLDLVDRIAREQANAAQNEKQSGAENEGVHHFDVKSVDEETAAS